MQEQNIYSMSNMLFLVYRPKQLFLNCYTICIQNIYNFTGFIKINNDHRIKSKSAHVLASMQTNM